MKNLRIIGHRGAAGLEAENTIPSFQRALSLGVDAVELDVWFMDNELFVFHDLELNRLTGASGRITEQTKDSIRNLLVRGAHPIPTLDEVLRTIDRGCAVNIELKGPHTAAPVGKLLTRYVSQFGWQNEEFLVSSFDHQELKRFKTLASGVPIGALVYGVPHDLAACVSALGAATLNISNEFVSRELVNDIHARGARCLAYTVNDPNELKRLDTIGVDGVFTDFPNLVSHKLTSPN
jgi:glycerophosphoryl diester phosphodiesterase